MEKWEYCRLLGKFHSDGKVISLLYTFHSEGLHSEHLGDGFEFDYSKVPNGSNYEMNELVQYSEYLSRAFSQRFMN